MRKKNLPTLIVSLIIVAALGAASFTSDGSSEFLKTTGIWSILPPLIAISLAFVTKNVVVSLLVGVLSGTYLISVTQSGVLWGIVDSYLLAVQKMLDSLADSWNAGIVLQVLAIGGLIALVTHLGGARAIAEKLASKAKGPVSAQIITWLLGLIVFFDDYANSLIIGPIMRPVTDKLKVSREKLAFIVDATAAPVAGIALISTWIGYEISCINQGFDIAGITGVSAYNLFVNTIPYRFYNILMLAFVVFSAVMLRDFGPMLKAENRARAGEIRRADVTSTDIEGFKVSEKRSNIWDAIIPLSVLVIFALGGFYFNGRAAILGGEDAALISVIQNSPVSFTAIRECFGQADASIVLFQSALLAGVVALIMGLFQKKMTVDEGINTWISGVKSLVITCVILILAWSLSLTIKELGTAQFLVASLSDSLPRALLPATIFILGSIISFATGTSYGTMGILMPLAIPFAWAIAQGDQGYLVAVSSAVLTGAIFGDHCSPISDTTILSSMGADCDHLAHVNTQIWYAIPVAIIALVFGFLPVGMGISVWIALPVAIIVTGAFLFIFGKKVKAEATKNMEKTSVN